MPSDNSAILAAINAVNDNVVATREDVGELRKEISGLTTRVSTLETEKASEKGVWKGFKMPIAAGGALILVLLDHMDHGKALISWIWKS